MKNLIRIDPIAVKDKNDVIKALTILEKIGIKRMSEEQKKNYLADEKRTVDNNFMIQEDDGGFRIQSHYLGFGISLENLEKQVENIIERHPGICERLKEIMEKKKQIAEEINKISEEFKSCKESFPIIELEEN